MAEIAMKLLAVMIGAITGTVLVAILAAELPLLLCRLGFHRWETPPYFPLFAAFPQNQVYEQCTRIGCWKKRYVAASIRVKT